MGKPAVNNTKQGWELDESCGPLIKGWWGLSGIAEDFWVFGELLKKLQVV